MSDHNQQDDNSFKAFRERQQEKKQYFENKRKEPKRDGRGSQGGNGGREGREGGGNRGGNGGNGGQGKREFNKGGKWASNNKGQTSPEANEDYIAGIHPVMEALQGDRTINRIMIERGKRSKPIHEIIVLAKEKSVVVQEVDKQKLVQVAGGEVHQGVVAYISPYAYYELDDAIADMDNGEMIVALDHLTDVHNFGSILRSCEAAGVKYVIIPQRRSVQVNATVAKTSAGAIEHVKVVRVTSLTQALEKLKDAGFWVIGADMSGEKSYDTADYDGKLVLVAGSEGEGMSRHTKQLCDHLVSIPMVGKVNSLNVSVATSLLVYEWRRRRDAKNQ